MARHPKQAEASRIPVAVDGIQVNVCREPSCENFGIEPETKIGSGHRSKPRDKYRRVRAGPNGAFLSLCCTVCSSVFGIKSNLAVAEEFRRLLNLNSDAASGACRTSTCQNFDRSVADDPSAYVKFGVTTAGSPRYRCTACKKTFSIAASPTHRLRHPEKSELIFRLLINKSPMRRICEVADIRPETLYQRIGYLHDRVMSFALKHEMPLRNGEPLDRDLHIAMDCQDYVLNWGSQFDRRTTTLSALAVTENITGYAFIMSLGFDSAPDAQALDLEARSSGDYDREPAFRQHARVALPGELEEIRAGKVNLPGDSDGADAVEPLDPNQQLPALGVRVHKSYAFYANMMMLERLTRGARQLRLYSDFDAAIRGPLHFAFRERLLAGEVETFFVRIAKEQTVDKKKLLIARAEQILAKYRDTQPSLTEREAAIRMMAADYRAQRGAGTRPLSRWIQHPIPNMAEPSKQICYLSDRGAYSAGEVGALMFPASLHSVDRFQMQIRRRISLLERPILTASNLTRRWHGYSAYNPMVVSRLLDLFRVAYNFSLPGADRRTPAMRMGLAKRAYTLSELILGANPPT